MTMIAQSFTSTPHDLDAELAVLGSIALDPDRLDDVLPLIRPDDFHSHGHRVVYRAICDLHDDGATAIDAIMIRNALSRAGTLADAGGDEYLLRILESVPHASHAEHYAHIVADQAKRRRAINAAQKLPEMASRRDVPIDETLSEHIRDIEGVLEHHAPPESTIGDVLLSMTDTSDPDPIATGLPSLDHYLGGGYQRGRVYVIGARTSIGKTAFATGSALHAARSGYPVAFFSYEMTREDLAGRLIRHTGKDLHEAAAELHQLPLWLCMSKGHGVEQLGARVRAMSRQRGLRLAVIDYLTLIPPRDRRLPRFEQVAELSGALFRLAESSGVPLLVLAQLNRGAVDRQPRASDLRDSGAIEQDADVVLLLTRYRDPIDNKHGTQNPRTGLLIEKNRHGDTGSFEMRWDRQRVMFAEDQYV